ncbi:site-specific DNA-methyltransferase [Stenoxybacter acetivorans]|uniref:site-specific DNA-methyltransferase n=1 Tax=Stenoxybacter acetivorans TaxID=422441 RepID=UPI0006914C30|nr:site-specific DNA-methyltransferase [Stenoxybacter acetivorans]
MDSLKAALPQFFNKNGEFLLDAFTDAIQKNHLQEARDGYRLDFVGKDYARLQSSMAAQSVLIPDVVHNQESENAKSDNVFITGDNLEVLRHLQNAYTGKVKMIYIDPPYNTGKEFVYHDKFEFSDDVLKTRLQYDDAEIQRLKSLQGRSSHSAWLAFMYPRLKLARQLLRDDGVIFVSIDDNEQAQLKLLMDEVFGEGNFVGDIIRKTKSQTNDAKNGLNYQHEFILVYAKDKLQILLKGEIKDTSNYKNPDNDAAGAWVITDPSARSGSDNARFEIKNPYTGTIDLPPKGRYWAFAQSTFNEWVESGKVVFRREIKSGQRGFIIKKYLSELRSENNLVDSLFFIGNEYMNQVATKELNELFGDIAFTFPKPMSFIKKLIQFTCNHNDNDLILDFFAGSATTAHAVMQLNAEDGGNRRFMLAQWAEQTPPDSEARKAGFQTIDQIARTRIHKAAVKIRTDFADKLPEHWDGGFQHFICREPAVQALESIQTFEAFRPDLFDQNILHHFAAKDWQASGEAVLLQTWLIEDGNGFDIKPQIIRLPESPAEGQKPYLAHYLPESQTLYLLAADFHSEALLDLLNRIGSHQLAVNTLVVYPYSFGAEAMRELETNVKTNLQGNVHLLKRY